jgi:SAM-dependent methyltransferase
MSNAGTSAQSQYVLGHNAQELRRLNRQAALVGPFTQRFLENAGISSGMRVLDVGCGGGDVSLLIRHLVGEDGEVVGIDRSETAIAHAIEQSSTHGLVNVSFRVGDPSEMEFDEWFDGVAGRYVLMFQPNPAQMLEKLAQHVKPGGIVVFHECDLNAVRSLPVCPTYDQCWRWIIAALKADIDFGSKFPSVFRNAGLPFPTLQLEALMGAGSNSADLIELTVGLVESLLSEIKRQGMLGAVEIDMEHLKSSLESEATHSSAFLLGRYEIGAWCRKI